MEFIPKRIETNKRYRRKKRQQLALVILWGLFLSVNIFVENLESFLSLQSIHFKWNPSPNYLSFFNFHDLTQIHPIWFLIKPGHFVGFAIMNLLLYNLIKNYKVAITITIGLAIASEILQLFFGRDGRLYDVIIDSLGVLTEYYVVKKRAVQK